MMWILQRSLVEVVALDVHICLTLIEFHQEFNQESIWQMVLLDLRHSENLDNLCQLDFNILWTNILTDH